MMKFLTGPIIVALLSANLAVAQWTQVWADDFNGPANSAPDPSKWAFDLGANGWGNHELEDYSSSRDNVFLDGTVTWSSARST